MESTSFDLISILIFLLIVILIVVRVPKGKANTVLQLFSILKGCILAGIVALTYRLYFPFKPNTNLQLQKQDKSEVIIEHLQSN